MQDLIKALQIFAKYTDAYAPLHCSYDKLTICEVSIDDMHSDDIAAVQALGFDWDEGEDCWYSFRFGSA
jgi:hypothetical protein